MDTSTPAGPTTPTADRRDRPDPTPALLTPFWPVDFGSNGVVTYVDRLARSLRSRGVRPILVTNRTYLDADSLEDPPVRGFRVERPPFVVRALNRLASRLWPGRPPRDAVPAAIAATVRECVRRDGVELLEMEESFGWAAEVGPAIPVPLIVRLHGPWFLNGPLAGAADDAAFRRRVARERLGLLAADLVSAPSRNVLDLTREYYGLALEDAVVVPNPAPTVPPESRWRLDDADPDAVLFIGRFDLHKGGDVMIDAFARVAETHPRARLRFVGGERALADADGKSWTLAEYVAAKASRASAEGRIEILGQQPWTSLADLRRRALVTVVPSRYDNFPNTVIEACAFGSPLVASRTGGIPEMVEDGITGLIVPPADAEALAAAIRRLLDDPGLAARLGGAAATFAERELGSETITDRTLDVYRYALAARAAASSRR